MASLWNQRRKFMKSEMINKLTYWRSFLLQGLREMYKFYEDTSLKLMYWVKLVQIWYVCNKRIIH